MDVRGDLDETIVSGLLGYAFKLQQSEVGAFLEMGRGTYDARSPTTSPIGHVKGDGKNNYVASVFTATVPRQLIGCTSRVT